MTSETSLSTVKLICCSLFLLGFIDLEMALLLIRPDKDFRCSGKEVHEFKVCSCLFDLTHFAIRNLKSINDFWRFYHNKLDLGINLYWNYHQGCYIACCRTFIEWATKQGDGILCDLCSKNCKEEWAGPSSCNCLDLLVHLDKLSDFCFYCNGIVSSFLIEKLHTFIVSEDGKSDESEFQSSYSDESD